MYVRSNLAAPCDMKTNELLESLRQMDPSPYFDLMSWQHETPHMCENVEGFYGPIGVMHKSSLATSPREAAAFPTGSYTHTEITQETRSDASTADTSLVADECIYMEDAADTCAAMATAWYAAYTAPADSWQGWQQTEWMDNQHFSEAPKPELLTSSARDVQDVPMGQGLTELMTSGSASHQAGQCKPCAFAWKPVGCQDGPACKFCHLCPAGEKQRRKRVLRQIQRNAGVC